MFLGTALVLTGTVLAAYLTDVLGDTELDTVDARFAIRGDDSPPDDVIVVGIDDETSASSTSSGRSGARSTPS